VPTWFPDDRDGYGDPNNTIAACEEELDGDYIAIAGDCDDSNQAINSEATEQCDGIDNNCDNDIDEVASLEPSWE
jgi:hypothetical protein